MLSNMESYEGKPTYSTFSRISKYILFRGVTLFLMVAVGIFLAIVIINYGGYIDKIHQADINEALNFISLGMRGASSEELAQVTEQLKWSMEEAAGLHSPFLLRCIRWFYQTMTFDWGITYRQGVDRFFSSKPAEVRTIVLERLPYTLLLAGATNLILFFASIFVALNLTKKYGSLIDRFMIALSPLSSIPNWVYGIVLTVIFAGELHILPFNGMFDMFPPTTKWGYIPIVAKHMILPVSAIFLGMFFSTVYTWRTFFLIHAGEDYLELAQAKGLPAGTLQRRYMLKPTLPYIITSFIMLMITFWQGIIVLEVFFDWPGLGQLFMNSIEIQEMSVTIGIVVVFAFLLGISVFLLEIIYVLVDPRVKISTEGQSVSPFKQRDKGNRILSSVKLWWSSKSFKQVENLIAGIRQRFIREAHSATPVQNHRKWEIVNPVHSPQMAEQVGIVPWLSCPYLKLENDYGLTTGLVWERGRCHVHSRPERIGRAFQAEICQSSAYRACPRLMPFNTSRPIPHPKDTQPELGKQRPKLASGLITSLLEFRRYPAAIVGVTIIIALIGVSIYTMFAIPYKEAILLWGPETVSKYQIPKNALPVWVNWFRKDKLPLTIIQNSVNSNTEGSTITKVFTPISEGVYGETITYTINYPYGGFPQDMIVIFNPKYEKKPFVTLTWLTPDGREFTLGNFTVVSTQRYLVSQDLPKKDLTGQILQQQGFYSGAGGSAAVHVLFTQPNENDTPGALKGTYNLRVDATLFEPDSSVDAELILYGQVYGLAGTDDYRRDLMIALLWGIPIALAFGFLGALSTGLISMIIAAVGVWFGGWLDGAIQRLTEINMILPTLPIAITIYYLYSKSIWMILGVIIILSIFGSAIKTYRSAFIQAKEMPYIEAAQAYGASNWRIIRHYMVPRIIPLLIPQLVILVPSYVFFEATLAYLKVSDPVLPTWGKVVYDALTRGTFQGYYYWVLEPVALMIVTALAFAVVGFALDSILNPRLRRM